MRARVKLISSLHTKHFKIVFVGFPAVGEDSFFLVVAVIGVGAVNFVGGMLITEVMLDFRFSIYDF